MIDRRTCRVSSTRRIERFQPIVVHIGNSLGGTIGRQCGIDDATTDTQSNARALLLGRLHRIYGIFRCGNRDFLTHDRGAGGAQHIATGDGHLVAGGHRHRPIGTADQAAVVGDLSDVQAVGLFGDAQCDAESATAI